MGRKEIEMSSNMGTELREAGIDVNLTPDEEFPLDFVDDLTGLVAEVRAAWASAPGVDAAKAE